MSVPTIRFGRMAPTLPVADIERARDFYVRVLGFEKTFENGDPVGFMVLKQGAAELHLTLAPAHRPTTHNVAHLVVDDVDALHEVCQRHKVRILKGLRDMDFGMRAFVFADPDGNRIDVGAPLDN